MQNKIQSSGLFGYTASSAAVKGGELVKIGNSFFGVAVADIALGATGIADTCGVFSLPKASGEIAQGAPVYVNGEGKATATATAGAYAGRAHEAAASSAAEVAVLLNAGVDPLAYNAG